MSDNTPIILAALAIVATCVGALVWIVKFLMGQMKESLDKNAAAHEKVAKATKLNTAVSQETLTFMKNLNGKLAKATIQTVKEETVEHQTINKVEAK
jgi:hypothetical protein